MHQGHLKDIAQLERDCFSTPWTESMLFEELYNDTASFLVAEGEDGTLLGYAGLHVALDEGYIANVAVGEAYRRQGVADALLNVYKRFGQVNLAFLTLEVRVSNRPAIDFYLKQGFEQVGRRKDFYQAPKEDALIMTLRFGAEEVP